MCRCRYIFVVLMWRKTFEPSYFQQLNPYKDGIQTTVFLNNLPGFLKDICGFILIHSLHVLVLQERERELRGNQATLTFNALQARCKHNPKCL